jgi:DNA-binding CsgD family transcriptional regulator/predicted nucleic-acid-binding Zn-ribbon protein
MNEKEIATIIEQAKAGDRRAKDTIIRLIQDNGYMRMVNRYLYMNRLLEPDEVKSEFWMGVILAMPKVNSSIGDPLFYLSWQGVNRVKYQLRKRIGKGVQFLCKNCGYVGRLYRKNKEYQCRKCGSKNYGTYQKEINITTLIRQDRQEERYQDLSGVSVLSQPGQLDIDIKLDYEYIKSLLTPQEARVLSLIMEEGIDQEHEQNYLKTIGSILHISAQAVCQYLRRVRTKLAHMREELR